MAIDNSFMKKKFESFKEIFVLYNQQMRVPFIECDDETYDDQVYVFTTQEMAQEYARRFTNEKYLLVALQMPQKVIRGFLLALYEYGVNAVVVQDEGAPMRVQLTDLVDRPDLEAMKNDKIPRCNPELQLTAIYFMQELRRPIERDQEEKRHLHELEAEMAHYLLTSRLIITFDVTAIKGKFIPGDPQQQKKVKIPLVRTKDNRSYQPIYTDFGEFRRFNSKNKQPVKLNLLPVTYDKLPGMLIRESRGFVFNPGGFNLVLEREQIEQMRKVYGKDLPNN